MKFLYTPESPCFVNLSTSHMYMSQAVETLLESSDTVNVVNRIYSFVDYVDEEIPFFLYKGKFRIFNLHPQKSVHVFCIVNYSIE